MIAILIPDRNSNFMLSQGTGRICLSKTEVFFRREGRTEFTEHRRICHRIRKAQPLLLEVYLLTYRYTGAYCHYDGVRLDEVIGYLIDRGILISTPERSR